MTREEIKEMTSLCFLLNPNNSEEEKNCVIEKVMSTKATIVSKPALCNIITYLQKKNAGLKEEVKNNEDLATVAYMQGAENQKKKADKQLSKAREIILKLYNCGRDVLMCRTEEKAYDNLSEAINDRSIEQFLKEE